MITFKPEILRNCLTESKIIDTSTLPAEATNKVEQGRNLGIAEIRVGRHRTTLADCLAPILNRGFDSIIRSTFLPIWISEITRIRAQASCRGTLPVAIDTVANKAAGKKNLPALGREFGLSGRGVLAFCQLGATAESANENRSTQPNRAKR